MLIKEDICTLDDIKLMVNTFYTQIQQDPILGPVFNQKIGDRWPVHLEKMYGFWQTILLNVHSYSGSPFPPHKQLPVGKEHFERWTQIFEQTINSLFEGPLADEAKMRAKGMADMFHYKIEYFRNENQKGDLLNQK